MKPNTYNNGNMTYDSHSSEAARVKNITVLSDKERKEREEQVAEELYRIFTHKI